MKVLCRNEKTISNHCVGNYV